MTAMHETEELRHQPSRAREFVSLYNKIDTHLRQLIEVDRFESFANVVRRAAAKNRAVSNKKDSLIAYGELRNAIIHSERYPDVIIAEPNQDALDDFRSVVQDVMSPPKLYPRFKRDVRCFAPADPLVEALESMHANRFSQVVVRREAGVELLTVEGVSRWLARQAETDIISVCEATIQDVLEHELPRNCLLMCRDATIYDAEEAFSQFPHEGRARLSAILVTQHGRSSEALLGIVTPWDLRAN
jgi:CBS domain-containing protein